MLGDSACFSALSVGLDCSKVSDFIGILDLVGLVAHVMSCVAARLSDFDRLLLREFTSNLQKFLVCILAVLRVLWPIRL